MSNKEKAALVPKLRFPEFQGADEWAPKCVEDYFNVGSSKRVLQQDWTTQGIPFYRTRELVSLSKGEPFASEIFIAEKLFSEITERYGAPKEGDFLVSGVGTLGISYLVKPKDKFYFKDGNVLWFETRGGISSTYFKYCFESDLIQNQILKQAAVSTVGTYTIQNAKTTKLFVPPNAREQQKIADCLSSLDELIAAQARKVDALKTHKKGLMQQLFPREGETQPRLRFPEFQSSGDWVPVCVAQFAKVTTGAKDTQNKIEGGRYPFFVRSQTVERINSFSFDGEAVLTSGDGVGVGKNFHYIKGKFDFHQRVYCIFDFAQDVSGLFFYLYFSEHFGERVMRMSAKNSVDSVRMAMITEMPVMLPKLPEQQRIAECLTTLDELITTAAQEFETLRIHKKGLMQQLFPLMEEAT